MDIVNLLLDTQSIDINKQNKAGYTAIMLASLAHVTTDRQRDIIARMFGMGDVNARASQVVYTFTDCWSVPCFLVLLAIWIYGPGD